MTDAYVNILVDAGAVTAAADEITDLDAVSTVHVVTGEYDIIAQLELDDPDDLPGIVADEIHSVSGVVDTITNVAFEP
ncbi:MULTISPECIES: Lrp/AsnC ligand binding domain-containing protein [Natrialbaceae]|uniref:Lrp/AsnC ligand binding domain-containing protein n=1 Tax=Natrialbaceae TaxID=1644061 RepID=UPI00207D4C47|nr:Lrp/AsnC ligand binding domain-containing protein [Natronococcus sp. CG52]